MAAIVPSSLRSASAPDSIEQSWFEKLFPANPRLAFGSIICIWAGYLFLVIISNFLNAQLTVETLLNFHLPLALLSIVITWLLYRLILFLGGGPTSKSIWILVTLPSVILSLALVQIDRWASVELHFFPVLSWGGGSLDVNFDAIIPYLILVAWGGVYSILAQRREMESALINSRNLRRTTRESELRALRYQLNPHFVFNALNSVSSLVVDNKNREAEELIDGLADYMRVVLNDEGQELVTVAKEISQQVRYLEIEQVRFPKRLQFETQIADDVADWKIPALIVQPLIENAIKYGVARSSEKVTITVEVFEEKGRLKIVISNTGRMVAGTADDGGTGTGLANVRDRLEAVYGPSAGLFTGNSDDDMAVATIIVPDETQILRGSAL